MDSARLLRAIERTGEASSDFDLNTVEATQTTTALRPAAVLLGVTGANTIILTKRSSRLKHHPGQIAFPGGKVEQEDGGFVGAALREAREEIGLPSSAAEVLGTLPIHVTITQFSVVPVVALIRDPVAYQAEVGEVEEVFEVPFDHVTDPMNFRVEGRMWRGKRRHYYTVPYGPYYIWGATARILRGLADRIQDAED